MSVMITRRGSIATEQALTPTITEIEALATSITFTITNNDTQNALIIYEIDDDSPDEFVLELGAGQTSSQITKENLSYPVTYTVYAKAVVQGKQVSEITSKEITTVKTYVQATGGTITTYSSGGKNYKSHTFTSSGTFTVSSPGSVEYLIVAGGGGGGKSSGASAGGGGAGGYRSSVQGELSGKRSSPEPTINVSNQSYSIIVGGGGSGQSSNNDGAIGSPSSAFGISSLGGGGGGLGNCDNNGGSGGGGGTNNGSPGAGTEGQGYPGNTAETNGNFRSAGGGGAGGQGAGLGSIGVGGVGLQSAIRNGSNIYYAGGGGGAIYSGGGTASGGAGGGGNGAPSYGSSPSAGQANTGGGGGGSGASSSASGGSGIVIIRYEVAS